MEIGNVGITEVSKPTNSEAQISHLALDIGGSLIKLVYFSTNSDNSSSLNDSLASFNGDKRRPVLEGKLHFANKSCLIIHQAPTALAPGFRFHPTHEELVIYYLKRKLSDRFSAADEDVEVHCFARFVSSSGGRPNDVAFGLRSTHCRRQHSAASQNDSSGRVSALGVMIASNGYRWRKYGKKSSEGKTGSFKHTAGKWSSTTMIKEFRHNDAKLFAIPLQGPNTNQAESKRKNKRKSSKHDCLLSAAEKRKTGKKIKEKQTG
ncbi:hypothetical protein ACFX15_032102 [Malus domestica]